MATVASQLKNGVLKLTLNRPEVHNAMDLAMIAELTRAFKQPETNLEIRMVHLSGKGKSFCSGADLHYMKSMASFNLEKNQADSINLFEMFEAVLKCSVPVIAYLHGSVMGGGMGLAAACDYVAAEEGTKFCFSEVKLGLVPAVISPFVFRKMENFLAREMMLTARLFESEEAKRGHLVQFVGDRSSCKKQLNYLSRQILKAGPEAVRETKRLLNFVSENSSWSDVKEKATRVIAERRVSPEGQEGIGAFFEKRKPQWRQENL